MRRAILVAALVAALAAWGPVSAAARERIDVSPSAVRFGETLTVRGAAWPVIEFCSRSVRLSLLGGQNAVSLGRVRVRDDGSFRFRVVVRRSRVGLGFWLLVARMRCESGQDGSPVIRQASRLVRIGRPRVYCSPSGDLCYGIKGRSENPVLRIDSFVNFGRYALCVTAPTGSRTCKRFRLREQRPGLFGSAVRWSRHFPDAGAGTYRVRWRTGGHALGPRLGFRRGAR